MNSEAQRSIDLLFKICERFKYDPNSKEFNVCDYGGNKYRLSLSYFIKNIDLDELDRDDYIEDQFLFAFMQIEDMYWKYKEQGVYGLGGSFALAVAGVSCENIIKNLKGVYTQSLALDEKYDFLFRIMRTIRAYYESGYQEFKNFIGGDLVHTGFVNHLK
jgi:hypothetical protein